MSLDLAVWSEDPINLPKALPQGWVSSGVEFVREGNGWQILALASDDDPPAEVLAELPSAQSAVYLTLEPIGAPPEAYSELESVVRHLAQVSGRVWVDPNGEAHAHDAGDF